MQIPLTPLALRPQPAEPDVQVTDFGLLLAVDFHRLATSTVPFADDPGFDGRAAAGTCLFAWGELHEPADFGCGYLHIRRI